MQFPYRNRFLVHSRQAIIIVIILLVIAAIIAQWIPLRRVPFVLGGILAVLFTPGFFLTLILFPFHERIGETRDSSQSDRSLDHIERATLAIIFSIVLTSLVVYVLHNAAAFSSVGYKLTPRKFMLAVLFLHMVLAGAAAWRKRWLSLTYVIPIMVFPLVVVVLNQLGVALTARNFTLEFMGLLLVIVVLWGVIKFGRVRLNKNENS